MNVNDILELLIETIHEIIILYYECFGNIHRGDS